MGTRFELLLIGDTDAARLRAAGEEALEEIRRWHDLLSLFDKASVVALVNREAAHRPVAVPPEVAQLLRWCRQVTEATEGAFDIAVGHLMQRAGFRDAPRAGRPIQTSPANCDAVVPAYAVTPDHRIVLAPSVALDLGAVGKGWALDRAADILREHLHPGNLQTALFHGGTSSITAVGGPWRVALDQDTILHLTDESLGLSAPSGRKVAGVDGREHGHILNPRTGESARAFAAAAVTGPSAAVCDAWSTALVVDPGLTQAPTWPFGYLAHTNAGTGFIQHAQIAQPDRALAQGTPA
jgi:thiamine biosynthesis lipoprotein